MQNVPQLIKNDQAEVNTLGDNSSILMQKLCFL